MTTLLDVYDEQRPGAERQLRHRLELPAARITGAELIRCRITADVALHNADVRRRAGAQSMESGGLLERSDHWLVTPGAVERALNGERGGYGGGPGSRLAGGPDLVESEPLVKLALEAFARNGFFMIVDGRQVTDLDEVLTIEDDSAAVFLRLVQLVGG